MGKKDTLKKRNNDGKNKEGEHGQQNTDWKEEVQLTFPLFCVATRSTPNAKDALLVVGGGGGTSKTGIPNKLCFYRLKEDENLLKFYTSLETEDSVKCVSLHPSKPLCIYGSGNSSTIVSLEKTGLEKLKTLQTDFLSSVEDSEQRCLCFMSNGNGVITGGTDGIVRIWDFPSMNMKSTLKDDSSTCIDELDLGCNDTRLAVSTQNACKVWNIKEVSVIKQFTEKTKFKNKPILFKGCKFSKDGTYLVLGKIVPGMRSWLEKWKYDQSTNAWTLTRNVISHRTYHHTCFDISSNSDLIVTGTLEGTVAVFTSSNLHKIMEVKPHDFFVTRTVFSPDNTAVFSVSADYFCKRSVIKHNTGSNFVRSIWVVVVIVILASVLVARFYPQ